MTAQFEDGFHYRDVNYSVVGLSDGGLFDIEALGMKPVPATTSCWRGYYAVFAFHDSR